MNILFAIRDSNAKHALSAIVHVNESDFLAQARASTLRYATADTLGVRVDMLFALCIYVRIVLACACVCVCVCVCVIILNLTFAGPLDGVPIAVKEEMDVIGYHTTLGSPFLAGDVSSVDCFAIARLRAAG